MVTFYFAGPLRVVPLDERVIVEMFEATGGPGEIMIGVPSVAEPVLLDAELVYGPSELTEYLMQARPPGELVWGAFPGVEEPDSITIVLVDRDGVLRTHSY